MTSLLQRYYKICPRTGKLRKLTSPKGFQRLLVPLIGIAAMCWIVFRVVTKPSRIQYPCVRAAMPLAAGAMAQIVASAAVIAVPLRRNKKSFVYLMVFFCSAFLFLTTNGGFRLQGYEMDQPVFQASLHQPNVPTGDAKGIFPGRVVWVHNPRATNQNCQPKAVGHEWFRPENNDQTVVDSMVSSAIQTLTGTLSDSASWNAVFRFHNNTRGKGSVGYKPGEKFFIKTNATSSWSGNFNTADLTPNQNVTYYAVSETSPSIVLAVLRQLVNVVGVAQSDIYVGDPMKHIYKHCYDLWHSEFASVHYLDYSGYTNLGREKVAASTTAKISYSDRGTVLKTNGTTGNPVTEDYLYTIFENTEYMLNIPMLKGHKRGGITMFAKNHFGSHTRSSAAHLHGGLVAPNEENPPTRPGYGLYRVQVDLMGHKLFGGKNLFYLMDALWATDYELDFPLKWKMLPFDNDWMSSIFASLDPVAIESVGYDFLRSEYTAERGAGTYAQMDGADDYLHQASDTLAWPSGIRYDPENDGIVLASLGVHEHWNDSLHMQYSRNLGTGDGIELVRGGTMTRVARGEYSSGPIADFEVSANYPNPFNPETKIRIESFKKGTATIRVFNSAGQLVASDHVDFAAPGVYTYVFDGRNLSTGVYLTAVAMNGRVKVVKLQLVK